MNYVIRAKWKLESVTLYEVDEYCKETEVCNWFPDEPAAFAEGMAAGMRSLGRRVEVLHDENN